MPGEFEFAVTLNADDRLNIGAMIATLREVETILRDVERSIRGEKPQAKWEWAEHSRLPFVASVNGVTEQELRQIVSVAREGFVRAREAVQSGVPVQWPTAFGSEARRAAENILRRLKDLESLTVEATGQPAIEIREARFEELVHARPSRRAYSSVDGRLELVAHRGANINVGLREYNTERYVRCVLAASLWLDLIREQNLWDRRVIVTGRVAYDDEGQAVSVIDVTDIALREPGGSLVDYRGAMSDLAGGLSTEEYISRLRPSDG